MGIGQWNRVYIPAPVCNRYNIKPGDYLVMYNGSTGEFIIKDPLKGKIVYQKQINSIEDLAFLAPDKESSEAIQQLQKKKYPSAGGGYSNHHIIPDHLCDQCELTIAGTRYGVFKKDGDENLMLLPNEFHKKNHSPGSPYSNLLRDVLRQRWNALVDAGLDKDRYAIREAIQEIIEVTRDELKELLKQKGKTIRDV